jgi:hypothetical protein
MPERIELININRTLELSRASSVEEQHVVAILNETYKPFSSGVIKTLELLNPL